MKETKIKEKDKTNKDLKEKAKKKEKVSDDR